MDSETGAGDSSASSPETQLWQSRGEYKERLCGAQLGRLLGFGVEALAFLQVSLNMHQVRGPNKQHRCHCDRHSTRCDKLAHGTVRSTSSAPICLASEEMQSLGKFLTIVEGQQRSVAIQPMVFRGCPGLPRPQTPTSMARNH